VAEDLADARKLRQLGPRRPVHSGRVTIRLEIRLVFADPLPGLSQHPPGIGRCARWPIRRQGRHRLQDLLGRGARGGLL